MKHAGPAALDGIEPMLNRLRALDGLKEKSRGTFYRAGRAFLHFHEHGEEMYADVRLAGDFERISVTTAAEQRALIAKVRTFLSDGSGRARR